MYVGILINDGIEYPFLYSEKKMRVDWEQT